MLRKHVPAVAGAAGGEGDLKELFVTVKTVGEVSSIRSATNNPNLEQVWASFELMGTLATRPELLLPNWVSIRKAGDEVVDEQGMSECDRSRAMRFSLAG